MVTANGRAGRGWGVTEAASEKLASLNIGGGGGPPKRETVPPPMKAGGGWRGGNMYLLSRSQEVQPPHRSYARKVMG